MVIFLTKNQGYLRDRRLCQWAQKVKPSWLPNFQFNNMTFRLVWQKSSLKMEWRVMLRLHFSFYKHFCISNQEKVTGLESWNSGWFPISRNFQLGTIWAETGHRSPVTFWGFVKKTHKDPQVPTWPSWDPTGLVWPCGGPTKPCGSLWVFLTGPEKNWLVTGDRSPPR